MSSSTNPDINQLATRLGVEFKNLKLLQQACVHRSYVNEHPKFDVGHNERLEFLGDAVLELVTTEHLFDKFPDKTEGDLTAYRAALVNADSLSQAAQEVSLDDYILLSRGEARENGRGRQAILANAFEAVIGAIFLDQGYAAADRVIKHYILSRLEEVLEGKLWYDTKSFLQEKAQAECDLTPAYRVLAETGPDHDKSFVVGVYLGEELVGKGEGSGKQKAEQEAARSALASLGWNLTESTERIKKTSE